MFAKYEPYSRAYKIALLPWAATLLTAASIFPGHAQGVVEDFFQTLSPLGTGISAPFESAAPQIPLSQALASQPAPIRQPAAVSTTYSNPFGTAAGVSTGPSLPLGAGPGTGIKCSNNICQVVPTAPPPAAHQQSQSYQSYVFPHGQTFTPAPPPPPPPPSRRR